MYPFLTTNVQIQKRLNLVDDRGKVKGRLTESTVRESIAKEAGRREEDLSFEVIGDLMIVRVK